MPVALAREAVALARQTDDPATLLHVLHFARAGYMPADNREERTALDRETVTLAVRQGHRLYERQARLRLACGLLEEGDVKSSPRRPPTRTSSPSSAIRRCAGPAPSRGRWCAR